MPHDEIILQFKILLHMKNYKWSNNKIKILFCCKLYCFHENKIDKTLQYQNGGLLDPLIKVWTKNNSLGLKIKFSMTLLDKTFPDKEILFVVLVIYYLMIKVFVYPSKSINCDFVVFDHDYNHIIDLHIASCWSHFWHPSI